MLRGLPASIILHAGVIAAGSIVLPSLTRSVDTESVIVPIEMVELDRVADIAPRPEREAPETPPEEEEPPPALEEYLEDVDALPADEAVNEDPPQPPPEEKAPPPPEPETPEPEEDAPDPEQEQEPEPEAEPEAEPLIREERESLDDVLGEAANLFDKAPKEARKAPQPAPQPDAPLKDETPQASEAREGAGEKRGNTASVVAMIHSQLYLCWNDVDDLPNPERLNVTIRLTLARDGTLKRDAQLVKPARPPIGDRAMQVAIERALRAARRCAPYRLPSDALEFYEDWDDVTINLGPAYK